MKHNLPAAAAALSAALLLAAAPSRAEDPATPDSATPPLKVLAIGNSFSWSLLPHLPPMAEAAGFPLEFCNLFIGGCSLERHVRNCARAGADPAFKPYDVTWCRPGQAQEKFKSNVPQMLATQKWDVVSVQQASPLSWRAKSFDPWLPALLAVVRELAPDAEVVWHETWSYNPLDTRIGGRFPDWPIDQAEMSRLVESNALAAARAHGLRVIPAGLAVEKRRAALAAEGSGFDPATAAAMVPGEPIDLRGEPVGAPSWKDGHIAGDTIHLNEAGQYLQAATWLGFLSGRDVRDLPYAPDKAGDAAECAALLAAAQDALDETAARGWQAFAPKKPEPPVLKMEATVDGPFTPWVFVTPENGVVDAGTTPPLGAKDLCYAFMCAADKTGMMVTVVTYDDDVSTDDCAPGSVSCWAWDDDAVEIFLDGECARLPDSRADGGIHLKHGGEFSLVANGAAMSDFSGYPKSYAPSGTAEHVVPPKDFGVATNALWTGVVDRRESWRGILLAQPGCPAGFAPEGTAETTYVFYFSWAAMGRADKPERIGFNVGVQDDDGGGRRNHALYWTGNPARPFSDESAFGILELAE